MICSANQWPGFYMIGTSIMKELTIFTQSSMIIILQVPKFIQLGHFGYFPYYLLDLRKYLIYRSSRLPCGKGRKNFRPTTLVEKGVHHKCIPVNSEKMFRVTV